MAFDAVMFSSNTSLNSATSLTPPFLMFEVEREPRDVIIGILPLTQSKYCHPSDQTILLPHVRRRQWRRRQVETVVERIITKLLHSANFQLRLSCLSVNHSVECNPRCLKDRIIKIPGILETRAEPPT